MKNTNLLEKIGLILVVVGLILLLADSLTENEKILMLTKHNDILHWLGLGIWAVGYFIREKEQGNS